MGLEEDPNIAYARGACPAAVGPVRARLSPGKVHLLAAHLFVAGARSAAGSAT